VGVDRGVKSIANVTMMDDVLLLVSGAGGAGKSSVREGIAAALAPEVTAVELRDLDTVPQTPTLEWRQRMAAVHRGRSGRGDGAGRAHRHRSRPGVRPAVGPRERWPPPGKPPGEVVMVGVDSSSMTCTTPLWSSPP